MNRQSNHQSGFSIVEAVVIVAAVAVIGTVGWFVYQHNRTTVTNAATSNTLPNTTNTQSSKAPATNSQAQVTNTTVVPLPELGIQITVPNSIKDLTYTANTVTLSNGNKGTYAFLSTTSLASADAKCGTSSGALGSLETASGQYPSSDQSAALDYGALLKQFPTFYVTYTGPQGGCSESAQVLSTLGVDKGTLQSALSTVQPLN